ncbi:hypothetical protein ACFQ3S_17335 [Mucilaginibacter terrae]|uniref:hypothetical protein n=1 Tax=Mucilaginibacter terrae TaxID=1955052 RepID=UPI00363470E4
MSKEEAEEYLNLFRIDDQKYLVGIFQQGITVYKQQIRALNIFYSLVTTERIKYSPDFRIGIIGGGVAGLTIAAAALEARLNVVLVEQEAHYLHMQRGCDIRNIHPNIYDWPDEEATYPSTKLPVLNWRHDTASSVAQQLLDGFEKVIKSIGEESKPTVKRLRQQYNSKRTFVTERIIGGVRKFQIKNYASEDDKTVKTDRFNLTCDLIIYAIGYGIEVGVTKQSAIRGATSYWRNDAYNQTFLDESNNFLVSGTGDGGMIDLFRLKILNFSYDYILNIMKSISYSKELIDDLRAIKKRMMGTDPRMTLFQEFTEIPEQYYMPIIDVIKQDRRLRNIEVCLNSKKENLESIFSLKRNSMINSFIAFVLYKGDLFSFKKGPLKYDEKLKEYQVKAETLDLQESNVIIRNGTNKKAIFLIDCLSSLERKKIQELKELQLESNKISSTDPLWSVGEMYQIFNDFQRLENPAIKKLETRLEFLPIETRAICSSFLSVLSNVLQNVKKDEIYSLNIHRPLMVQNNMYYQQITTYNVNRLHKDIAGVTLPIKEGSVGLSFKTGKPFLVKNVEDNKWGKFLELIKTTDGNHFSAKAKSFLTIPVLAPTPSKPGFNSTCLVLYVEAKNPDFFDQETIELIVSSINGFVASIDNLIAWDQVYMKRLNYEIGSTVDAELSQYEDTGCFEDLSLRSFNNKPFKDFYSFDLIYKNSFERFD